MHKNKKVSVLMILLVFIVQIVFKNVFSSSSQDVESVSESVYENVHAKQILMEPSIESMLIGDVKGDGNIDNIDLPL